LVSQPKLSGSRRGGEAHLLHEQAETGGGLPLDQRPAGQGGQEVVVGVAGGEAPRGRRGWRRRP
jgi:hypothetical protein